MRFAQAILCRGCDRQGDSQGSQTNVKQCHLAAVSSPSNYCTHSMAISHGSDRRFTGSDALVKKYVTVINIYLRRSGYPYVTYYINLLGKCWDIPMKVLVADGSAAARNALTSLLRNLTDKPIVEAENGRDCVHFLAAGGYDLAFIDVKLPLFSGLEVLGVARSKKWNCVCVATGDRHSDNVVEIARSLGAYDFIIKPFEQNDVERVVASFKRLQKRWSILMVDDSATTRKIIGKVLEDSFFDFVVDEVGDGASALQKLRSQNYDFIAMDLNMPGLNGLETLYFLRGVNKAAKVLLVTSTPAERLPADVREAEFDAILHKPFYAHDLDDVLHGILGMGARFKERKPVVRL